MNENFYFTYGLSEKQPFKGGWTKISAPNKHLACEIFRAYHPDRTPGILNCADVYDESQFQKTTMFQNGENIGAGCRETIEVMRTSAVKF